MVIPRCLTQVAHIIQLLYWWEGKILLPLCKWHTAYWRAFQRDSDAAAVGDSLSSHTYVCNRRHSCRGSRWTPPPPRCVQLHLPENLSVQNIGICNRFVTCTSTSHVGRIGQYSQNQIPRTHFPKWPFELFNLTTWVDVTIPYNSQFVPLFICFCFELSFVQMKCYMFVHVNKLLKKKLNKGKIRVMTLNIIFRA